jgi:hypothetical protein
MKNVYLYADKNIVLYNSYCMDIDLNLNNYTTHDLEKFFGVPSSYTVVDVEAKQQILLDKLIQINVNPQMQKDIVSFLNRAKEKLLQKMDIIPPQITPFVYNNPSDFFQGSFNPIEKRLITKTICIDTFFRSNYKYTKSTDYTYTFPETINNVVSIQIKSIEIPYVWYNISASQKNNFFVVTDSSNNEKTIIVPDGNYSTISSVITLIQAQLNSLSITMSNPTSTSSVQFTSTNNFTLNFTTSGPMSLGWLLGFRETLYKDLSTYTSDTSYSFYPNHYFFIDVDDFHNNHTTDAVISVVKNQNNTPSYIGNTIMARIPITTSYASTIMNTSSDYILKKRDYFGPVKLEKMNLRILNRFGEVVDMNKHDYSIVFEVTQLYS